MGEMLLLAFCLLVTLNRNQQLSAISYGISNRLVWFHIVFFYWSHFWLATLNRNRISIGNPVFLCTWYFFISIVILKTKEPLWVKWFG